VRETQRLIDSREFAEWVAEFLIEDAESRDEPATDEALEAKVLAWAQAMNARQQ
jgi:hypothetical protein